MESSRPTTRPHPQFALIAPIQLRGLSAANFERTSLVQGDSAITARCVQPCGRGWVEKNKKARYLAVSGPDGVSGVGASLTRPPPVPDRVCWVAQACRHTNQTTRETAAQQSTPGVSWSCCGCLSGSGSWCQRGWCRVLENCDGLNCKECLQPLSTPETIRPCHRCKKHTRPTQQS